MKLKSFIICAAMIVLAASCDSGSTKSTHAIGVPYPEGVAYADQQSDTLGVYSTDSWTATVTDGDWFTPNEFSKTVSGNKVDYSKYALKLQTSNGTNRKAYFTIKSNGKTLRKTYVQVSLLNISNPNPLIIRADSTVTSLYDTEHFAELKAYYYFTPTYKGGSDKIVITIYSPSTEISTSDDWISLQGDDNKYVKNVTLNMPRNQQKFEFTVPVTVQKNTGTTKRTGKINIKTSNGINQIIEVIQGAESDKNK